MTTTATGPATLAIFVALALPYAPAYAGGLGLATLARIAGPLTLRDRPNN